MRKKFLSLNEAVASVLESEDESQHDLVILPIGDGADSEVDEVDENDLCEENVRDIAGEIEVQTQSVSDDEDESPILSAAVSSDPASNKLASLRWTRREDLNISEHTSQEVKPLVEEFPALTTASPYNLFKLFCDDVMLDLMVSETCRYAQTQKNIPGFCVSNGEMEQFLAILLFSGYVKLPEERMYWSRSEDINVSFTPSIMSRDRFLQIKRCLHIADNANLGNSKTAKIQPIYDVLNNNLLQFGCFSKHLSIDESMVPYFGGHSAKMFIKGKPIRFGYKLWSLCGNDGYPYQLEIYNGRDQSRPSNICLGEHVVKSLISVVPNPQIHEFYFDNFFTSCRLMKDLSANNIRATGTIRSNRTEKCPLKSEKDMKATERGTHDYRSNGSVLLCRWNDNSVVTVATTFGRVEPQKFTRRFSRAQKKSILVHQPRLIANYNSFMGGVDVLDKLLGVYRCSIRGKKWWWNLFVNAIMVASVAAWRIHCHLHGREALSHLAFLRDVTICLAKKEKDLRVGKRGGKISKNSITAQKDGVGHYLIDSVQGRCRQCGKNCRKQCGKCFNTKLHIHCFEIFHR